MTFYDLDAHGIGGLGGIALLFCVTSAGGANNVSLIINQGSSN